MSIDNLELEYKELYRAEIAHRAELNSAIGLPISLITAFSGVLYFFVTKLTQPWSALEIFQIILFVIAACIILYAIYLLIRSSYNYQYEYVPTAKTLDSYRQEMLNYHSGNHDKAENAVLNHLYKSFIDSGETNATNNNERSKYLFQSKTCIIYVLLICVIIGFVHLMSLLSFEELCRILD